MATGPHGVISEEYRFGVAWWRPTEDWMNKHALVGWFLLGAFAASVSCSSNGGSGGAPRGFGLACASDKDCTGFSLLCHPSDDKCVQCLDSDDCKATEECLSGLCKAPERCEDSRDCSADTVCNEDVGVCVECLESRDCDTEQKCVAQHCVDQQTCEFTSDCEDGLLCDMDAGLCVTCREDGDCPSRRVCEDNECVMPGAGGSGGDGGTGGTPATAGNNSGGTPAGGTPAGGTGGSNGGSSSGSGGTAGTGGSPPQCECELDDVCTPDDRCVSPTVIDDMVDCDNQILEIEGRSGVWYAEADTDVNIMHAMGDPGTLWGDHSCAAWAVGGEKVNAVYTEFAILAAILADGLYYDLSAYSGLQVQIESDSPVEVVLKTPAGLFRGTLPGATAGTSELQSIAFSYPTMLSDTSPASLFVEEYLPYVTEIQFAAPSRVSFGFAIHRVELY